MADVPRGYGTGEETEKKTYTVLYMYQLGEYNNTMVIPITSVRSPRLVLVVIRFFFSDQGIQKSFDLILKFYTVMYLTGGAAHSPRM